MREKKHLHPAHKKFRHSLYVLMGLSFLFAATMSYFYIGMKHGTIAHKDIAPIAFATDIYLYETRAYWVEDPARYEIAKRLVKNGFFDRTYYYAGRNMMQEMAADGYPPAEEFAALYFRP